MRRPSFQFYPDDWRNNANLRRCSWAARGVWVEVMCLLHDSDRYGVLTWSLKELAHALGCPLATLRELVAKGVLKGCDSGLCEPLVYVPRSGRRNGEPVELLAAQPGPVWFSSRMVRDEYVRTHAGAATRFGASPTRAPDAERDAAPPQGVGGAPSRAPRHSPSRRHGEDQGDGSTSPSPPTGITDSSLRSESAAANEQRGKVLPLRGGGGMAEESLGERVRRGHAGEARAILATLKPALSDARMGQLLGVWTRDLGPRRADLIGILREAEKLAASERIAGDPIDWIGGAVRRRVSEASEGTIHDPHRPAERRLYGAGGSAASRLGVLDAFPELAGGVEGD